MDPAGIADEPEMRDPAEGRVGDNGTADPPAEDGGPALHPAENGTAGPAAEGGSPGDLGNGTAGPPTPEAGTADLPHAEGVADIEPADLPQEPAPMSSAGSQSGMDALPKPPSANHLRNPGFEAANAEWTAVDAGCQATRSGEWKDQGNSSLKLAAALPTQPCKASYALPLQAVAGKDYVFSGVFSVGASNARLEVAWYSAASTLLGTPDAAFLPSGSFSKPYVAPAGAASVSLSLVIPAGISQAYMDSVSWVHLNHPPQLSYTGEAGYASDGAQPDGTTQGKPVTFRVRYTDPDAEAPTKLNLLLSEPNAGGGSTLSVHPMSLVA
ncbi:MAG TPA: hypothetical protein VHI93_00420, partial [Candidatus Thermoplasmatota archaeon]|nr:hypothetical protein [Candidatus Thermoplasmatota archaeon]